MRGRNEFDRAFEAVRKVIHSWDPYDLLHIGAPPDEWDSEIRRLVAQISRIKTEKDAIQTVSDIFSAAFQPKGFTPADCAEVGHKLFAVLQEAGLLSHVR